jgi:hypothetical protein
MPRRATGARRGHARCRALAQKKGADSAARRGLFGTASLGALGGATFWVCAVRRRAGLAEPGLV